MESKQRIQWIDNCKGFATVLVVIGHIVSGYLEAGIFPKYHSLMQHSYNMIYSFHMPLFFVLSGYVFFYAYCNNSLNSKRKTIIQVFNLIYIYILSSCIMWIFKVLFAENVNMKVTINDLLLIPIKPIDPYWYLYVLVFYYIVFSLFYIHKVRDYIILIFSMVVSFIGSAINIYTVFPVRRIFIYCVFFYLGILFSKKKLFESIIINKNIRIGGVVFVVLSFVIIYNNYNLFKSEIIGIIPAIIICFFVLLFFSKSNINILFFRVCGRYSLEIYLLHCFITAANRSILLKLGLNNFFINVTLNFLLAVFVPILCSYCLKKLNVHRLLIYPFSVLMNKD